MKKRIISLLAVAALATTLFGSAAMASEADSSGSGKDTLVFSMPADITSVDAVNTQSYALFVNRQVYETLVTMDEDGEILPKLATSWEFSDDNTVLTLEIREGVTFQNGELMTVDDVVYSLERAFASAMTGTKPVESVYAVDDTHVAIQMEYAYTPMINYLTQVFYSIVPKDVVEATENEMMDISNACGTGPYEFVEWDSGEKIVLQAYDNYWQGEAAIKEITFVIQAEPSTAALALENGEVDVVFNAAETDLNRFESDDSITGEVVLSENVYTIWLNAAGEITSDPLVREAIALAVNKDELLMGGTSLDIPTASSLILTTSQYYTDLSEYEPTRDVEKAKELLAEAGYPDGFSITLPVAGSMPLYESLAVILQQELAEVGIEANIETMEATAYTQQVVAGRAFEVNISNVNGLMDDPDARFAQFISTSSTNYLNINEPEYDELVKEAEGTTSVEERKELYADCEKIVLYDEYYFIPLFYGWITYAYNSDLQGLYINGGFDTNLYDCYWN